MTTRLRQRIDALDPVVVDAAVAVGLALLTCLQIWSYSKFAELRPAFHVPPGTGRGPTGGAFPFPLEPREPAVVTYVLAAMCFLPLALRRKIPWLALLLSGGFALAYLVGPKAPPAFTTLGPMIALYTLAARAKRRRRGTIALIVVAMVLAVPLMALSGNTHWLRETVSTVVLLSASALLGDSARSRREYIEEVEQRALEAERTREEEAARRVDEERLRIAREVHDVLAHSLSIVTVQAAAAESLLDREPARAKESIGHIRVTSKQALAELRSMLGVLRTPDGDAPLAPAATLDEIDALVTPVREAGFDVRLHVFGELDAVPAFATVSAYRIVQEALTNTVRHSRAAHIDVTVRVEEEMLALEVVDDGSAGRDYDPDATSGHGIRGMNERVEALGGDFSAGPTEAGGFRVAASIPLGRTS